MREVDAESFRKKATRMEQAADDGATEKSKRYDEQIDRHTLGEKA